MESFPTEAAVLSCIPGTFFLEMFSESFRATSEKLVLENYVLAYHTSNKDHTKIFDLSFFFVLFVS